MIKRTFISLAAALVFSVSSFAYSEEEKVLNVYNWSDYIDPEVIPEWEQPDSTNPYMMGDKVTHNEKTWESTVDNNVWEPGVYGWFQIM